MVVAVPIDELSEYRHSTIFEVYKRVDEDHDRTRKPEGMRLMARDSISRYLSPWDLTVRCVDATLHAANWSSPLDNCDPVTSKDGKTTTFSVQLLSTNNQLLMKRSFEGMKRPANHELASLEYWPWEFAIHKSVDTFCDPSTEREVTVVIQFDDDNTFRKFDYIGALGDRLLVANETKDNNKPDWIAKYTNLEGQTFTDLDEFPHPIDDYVDGWISIHNPGLAGACNFVLRRPHNSGQAEEQQVPHEPELTMASQALGLGATSDHNSAGTPQSDEV